MKNRMLVPAIFVMSGLIFFSCKNAEENKAEMKKPIENFDLAKNSVTTTANIAEAKIKTIANMQAAFNGESNATARYAAFSKKASDEGYKEIAMLFKAASLAEKIHAENHKVVLEEMGVAVKPAVLDVQVNSTKENLEFAIKGETYEATEMYPNFLKEADKANSQLALISLNYAYKTEKKHKVYYEKALAALMNNTMSTLPTTYYICPTCGNTYETTAPKRCGISMTSGEKFIKV